LKTRLTRYAIALLLLLVAVTYPLFLYILNDVIATLLGSRMGTVDLILDLERGVWVLFVASGIAIVGAFGLFFRKRWGRMISMLAFALFALIALSMAILSPEQAQSWFSFSETRWVAAIEAVLYSTALGWLLSPLAKKEFQTNAK
jgi:hypothetical protein